MPVINGVSYTIAQPCLDLAAQIKAAGIANLGIIGDLSHQAGCGDHVPWACTGHYGWVTAIDIGWGGTLNSRRLSPALLRQYLLPRLRAHTWEFYQIKYIITGYVLNDTRAPYNLKDQTGGDGPDHMHISFLNSAVKSHCSLISDFIAWVKADCPNPVTFKPGTSTAAAKESHMASVLKADGSAVVFAVDVFGKLVSSTNLGDNWSAALGADVFDAGVSVARFGTGALGVACKADRSIYLLHIPNLDDPSNGYRSQRLPGSGGDTPSITILPDNTIVVLTKSTLASDAGAVYRIKVLPTGVIVGPDKVAGRVK